MSVKRRRRHGTLSVPTVCCCCSDGELTMSPKFSVEGQAERALLVSVQYFCKQRHTTKDGIYPTKTTVCTSDERRRFFHLAVQKSAAALPLATANSLTLLR